MRHRVLACLLLNGCLIVDNPAYGHSAGGDTSTTNGATTGGTASGATATTGGVVTATMTTPTGGAEDGSGSGSSTTQATSLTGDGETTGALTGLSTTGETDTTGAPARVCNASELVELVMEDDAVADAGVAPWGMPCPWQAGEPCDTLNFGKTEFYRLVNDGGVGRNAALIRFPPDVVAEQIAASGKDKQDLIGARLQLVVWEPKSGPDGPVDFEVHLLHPDNFGWPEGERDGQPAHDDESSAKCRTIVDKTCQGWAQGDALAGSEPLGLLRLTPENAMANDLDQNGNEYHAKITSEQIGMPLWFAYDLGQSPGLAVTLLTPRTLGEGEIGVKLRESPYDNPRLFAEFCTEWSM